MVHPFPLVLPIYVIPEASTKAAESWLEVTEVFPVDTTVPCLWVSRLVQRVTSRYPPEDPVYCASLRTGTAH